MARPLETPDFYAILEVSPTAPLSVIKESYRRLALKFHPDKNREDLARATEKFQQLSRAWEVLGDVRSRTEYDVFRPRRGGNERWWEGSFGAGGTFGSKNWEHSGYRYGDDDESGDLFEKARRRREDVDREANARFKRESRSSAGSDEEEAQTRLADQATRIARAQMWKNVASQDYRMRLQPWIEYRNRNSGLLAEVAATRRALKKAERELGDQSNATEVYVEGVFREAIQRSKTSGAMPGDHDHVILEKLFEARRIYMERLMRSIEEGKKKLQCLTRTVNWDGSWYELEEGRVRGIRVQEALDILGPRNMSSSLFSIVDRRGLAINRWNVLGRMREPARSTMPDAAEGPWHEPGEWLRVGGEHTCERCDQEAFHIIPECGAAMCPGCGIVVCNDCYRDLKLLQEYERWLLSEEGTIGESLFSLDFVSIDG